MNFTSQQKDLLFAIVDAHLSGDGAPFIFVRTIAAVGSATPAAGQFRSVPMRSTSASLLRRDSLPLSGSPGQVCAAT